MHLFEKAKYDPGLTQRRSKDLTSSEMTAAEEEDANK
jgi:hypothetical protein